MSDFDWGDDSQWKNNDDRGPQMKDEVDLIALPDNDWINIRLIGNPVKHMVHWIRIKTKAGKTASIRKDCLGFNHKTGEHKPDNCPYCTICEDNPRQEVYSNVIDRDKQENEPRKKRKPRGDELKPVMWNGNKHRIVGGKKSAWTPVRVLRATVSVGRKISEIASLNKRTIKGVRTTFGPNHPKFGFDILLKQDKNASPSEMYSVQKGDVCELTMEERKLLVWAIPEPSPQKLVAAEKEAKRLRKQVVDNDGNLLFEDESPKSKGKRQEFKDEFDADDDFENETKKKRRRPKDDFEEDDYDDDDDWGEEEPTPKKKRRTKKRVSKPSSKTRRPSSKVKSKLKKRRKPKDYDDDDIPF